MYACLYLWESICCNWTMKHHVDSPEITCTFSSFLYSEKVSPAQSRWKRAVFYFLWFQFFPFIISNSKVRNLIRWISIYNFFCPNPVFFSTWGQFCELINYFQPPKNKINKFFLPLWCQCEPFTNYNLPLSFFLLVQMFPKEKSKVESFSPQLLNF